MLDYRTETFLTVCKTLNFTTAAKQLNITQPAVSQHIHFGLTSNLVTLL